MKFGTNIPWGKQHVGAKHRDNLACRSSANRDGLNSDGWPSVANTGFRASTAVSKRLLRLTWNLEDVEWVPIWVCEHYHVDSCSRSRTLLGFRQRATRWKLGRHKLFASDRNRSAKRIGVKFSVRLRSTDCHWPTKSERKLSNCFQTADDARKPLLANPKQATAGFS